LSMLLFWMILQACRQGGKAPREWHTGTRISSLSASPFMHSTVARLQPVESPDLRIGQPSLK
jgi:hypothetical protein